MIKILLTNGHNLLKQIFYRKDADKRNVDSSF